jgi:hypothetical protein
MRATLKTLLGVVALSAACLGASAASAVVVTQTYDLTKGTASSSSFASLNNTGFSPVINNASPVALSNGDSLDLKITFLPGQAIQFTNVLGNFEIGLVVSDTASLTLNALSTLTLFDTGGGVIKTFAHTASTQSVLNVIGDDFFTAGVPLNGNLGALEYINPSISGLTGTKNFTADVISLQGSTMQVLTGQAVVGAPGVPEPAVWVMMLAGFGGIGAVLRRRRGLAHSRA